MLRAETKAEDVIAAMLEQILEIALNDETVRRYTQYAPDLSSMRRGVAGMLAEQAALLAKEEKAAWARTQS